MAACDKTLAEWGYILGGTGTDATVVNAGTIRVKAMAFAGNADNATCVLTTSQPGNDTTVSFYKFKVNGWDLDCTDNHVFFGEDGIPLTGLTVTLSHANDRLYLFLA